jgi:hypothetical protein
MLGIIGNPRNFDLCVLTERMQVDPFGATPIPVKEPISLLVRRLRPVAVLSS